MATPEGLMHTEGQEGVMHIAPPEVQSVGMRREIGRNIDTVPYRKLFLDSTQAVTLPLSQMQASYALVPVEGGLGKVRWPGVVSYVSAGVINTPDTSNLATNDAFTLEAIMSDMKERKAAETPMAGVGTGEAVRFQALAGLAKYEDDMTIVDGVSQIQDMQGNLVVVGTPNFFKRPGDHPGVTLAGYPGEDRAAALTYDTQSGQVQGLSLTPELLEAVALGYEGAPPILGWYGFNEDGSVTYAGRDYPLGQSNNSWPCSIIQSVEELPLVTPESSTALVGLREVIMDIRNGAKLNGSLETDVDDMTDDEIREMFPGSIDDLTPKIGFEPGRGKGHGW